MEMLENQHVQIVTYKALADICLTLSISISRSISRNRMLTHAISRTYTNSHHLHSNNFGGSNDDGKRDIHLSLSLSLN